MLPAQPLSLLPAYSISQLFQELEHAGPRATGALVFGDPAAPVGYILLESGKVCWAADEAMSGRLLELLDQHANAPLSRRLKHLARERKEGRCSGVVEVLVASGELTKRQVRGVLKQHIAEAMVLLAERGTRRRWVAHKVSNYGAEFTYTTAELLAASQCLDAPELAASAESELQCLAGATAKAVALAHGFGISTRVAASFGTSAATDLEVLQEYVEEWLESLSSFDEDVVYWAQRPGAAYCLWFSGELICGAVVETKAELDAVSRRLGRTLRETDGPLNETGVHHSGVCPPR